MSFERSVEPGPACVLQDEFAHVCRVLARSGVPERDVEDVAQEVFIVLWRRWGEFDPSRPLRPWLSGIATRVAQSYFRLHRRQIIKPDLEPEDQAPAGEERLARDRARALVMQALAGLRPEHTTILALAELESLPMHTIARQLQLPLFTAYTRLRTARKEFARAVRRLRLTARIALVVPAELGLLRPRGLRRRAAPERADRSGPWAAPRLAKLVRWCKAGGLAGPVALFVAPLVVLLVHAAGGGAARSQARPHPAAAIGASRARGSWRSPREAPRADLSDGAGQAGSFARHDGAAAPPRGLIGFWSFEDDLGKGLARDSSGAGNHCVIHGRSPERGQLPRQGEGAIGRGLLLARNGWLECPGGAAAQLGEQITLALWIRREQPAQGLATLLSRQLGSSPADHFFLGLDRGTLEFSSHLWFGVLRSPAPDAALRWRHVAITHDAAGASHLYVDGVATVHRATRSAPLGGGTTPVMIGGGANGTDPSFANELFDGAIDEVAMFSRALGDAEIAALAAGWRPEAPAVVSRAESGW